MTQPLKPLSRIQKAMLKMLSDGLPHRKDELSTCLWDELSVSQFAVNKHLCAIRKHLRPKKRDILCVYLNPNRFCYQLVKLLTKD